MALVPESGRIPGAVGGVKGVRPCKKPKGLKPLSPALRTAWRRALDVTEHDVANYIPTHLDAAIAGALLAGATSIDQIAGFCKVEPNRIGRQMQRAVAMRWISDMIHAHIGQRLGIVTAALFARAATGDVQACRLVFEKFGQVNNTTHVVHHKGLDLSHLSDDELSRLVRDKLHAVRDAAIIDITAHTALEGPTDQVSDPGGAEGGMARAEAPQVGSDDSGGEEGPVAVDVQEPWVERPEEPEAAVNRRSEDGEEAAD